MQIPVLSHRECIIIIKLVIVVAAGYDNCCKNLLLDWTLWEAYNKRKIDTKLLLLKLLRDVKPCECIEMHLRETVRIMTTSLSSIPNFKKSGWETTLSFIVA